MANTTTGNTRTPSRENSGTNTGTSTERKQGMGREQEQRQAGRTDDPSKQKSSDQGNQGSKSGRGE